MDQSLGGYQLQAFSWCLLTAKLLAINTHALLLDTSYHIGTDELNAQIQTLKLEQELVNINKITWFVLPYFLVEYIKNEELLTIVQIIMKRHFCTYSGDSHNGYKMKTIFSS